MRLELGANWRISNHLKKQDRNFTSLVALLFLTDLIFLRLRYAKSFAIAVLVFFIFFLLVTFSGQTAKGFLANVLTLVIKKTCNQNLTYSLDATKYIP